MTYTLPFRFGTKTKPDDQFQPQVGADFDDLALILNGGSSSPVVIKIPQDTLYVRSTGSDTTGDGLTTGTAFLTIQHAVDAVFSYDLNSGAVTIDVGPGNFDGAAITGPIRGAASGSNGSAGALIIKGDSNTTTNINGPPAIGDWAGAVFCFLAENWVLVELQAMNINVPSGKYGFYLQTFGNGTLKGMRMTGADNTCTGCHAEGYSFFEIADASPCEVDGTFGGFIEVGANAHWLHDSGTININGTVDRVLYADSLSDIRLLTTDAFALVGSGSIAGTHPYTISGNSMFSGKEHYDTIFGKIGSIATGARTDGVCTPAAITSTSGLGSGSATVTGNANGGVITLSPTGSPSGSGSVTVDFHEVCLNNFDLPAAYTVSAQDDSEAWSDLTFVRVTDNVGTGTLTIYWQNGTGPSALTAGETFQINYVCSG